MSCAVMQPYFLPYIGYWQLIDAVDTFVIFDDVNYFKKGFINRNSILLNGEPFSFTLELVKASQNKLINEIEVGNNKEKILKNITSAYMKAPYYNDVYPLIEKIVLNDEKNLAVYIGDSLQDVAAYLEINTRFIYSSLVSQTPGLKAQDKIIDICQNLNQKRYINAIGGQDLYSKQRFREKRIKLSFLETERFSYIQNGEQFVPYLSIIDVLMFNSNLQIKEMLNFYTLK